MINMMIAQLYRTLVPIEIRARISRYRKYKDEKQILKKIKEGKFRDFKDECDYMIMHNAVYTFPYKWCENYKEDKIKVYYDSDKKMPYCQLENGGAETKRIYFPRKWKKEYIKKYYNSLLCEQDRESPHYYFDKDDTWFDSNTLFIDAGSAEGFIALQIVDKVGKVILLECDRIWMEPLKATFEKWKDKVVIINKYAGETTGKGTCIIDEFIEKETEKIALKMDVEGNEISILRGATRMLGMKDVRAYICIYHNDGDEKRIIPILKKWGFRMKTSNTYMFYRYAGETDYSFRHGVLKCTKDVSYDMA